MANVDLDQFKDEDFCYLTTTGRVSGSPHTLEIWFALEGKTLYMLAGGREKSDWVKNILKFPIAQIKIGENVFKGRGRVVENEEEGKLARQLVFDKYAPRDSDNLTDWARTSLPVAIDLEM